VELMSIVKILSALLTPVLGVIATIVLVNQFILQKLRWRLDLWEKRYPVYLATEQYIIFAVQNAKMPMDEVFKFKRESKDKDFLFRTDVQRYLEELYQKGLELDNLVLHLKGVLDDDRRNKLLDEQLDLIRWFPEQFEVSKNLFGKYLRIGKR
jgi:hypothetical protein